MYYSCHLFLIPSASVRSIPFLSFIVPILHETFLGICAFLEEISNLPHSIVFPYFFALIGSLRKTFLSLLPIFWNSALKWVYLSFSPFSLVSLLFSTICKASSDNDFDFLSFFFLVIAGVQPRQDSTGTLRVNGVSERIHVRPALIGPSLQGRESERQRERVTRWGCLQGLAMFYFLL